MKNKGSVVRRSMLTVVFLALFALLGVALPAHAQQRQGPPLATSPHAAPSGRADLEWNRQDQVLTVILHLHGLEPGSIHAAHIHVGTCSMKGGILYPLNQVVADASGNATVMTTLDQITGGIPATGWAIRVHRGPTAQTSPLLCGTVVNATGESAVSVRLG